MLPAADLQHILDYTGDLWRGPLRGARIFITGGTGFFGKWLLSTVDAVRQQLGVDIRTVVLSRYSGDVTGDIRSFALPSGEFSHIIHAAAPTTGALEPAEIRSIILDGTARVLELAGAGTPLLFCSSGAVYGRQVADRVAEQDPLAPVTPYGVAKRDAEALCLQASREARIARCFAFAGPQLPLDAHFAAGNFLRDALAGGPIVIGGDGTPMRSYLYPADLMIWLWTMLAGAPGVYNVGSEAAYSIAELAEITRDVVNPRCAVEIRGVAREGQRPERYVPSTARAQAELGLRERIDLRESLRRWAAAIT